MMMMVTVRRRVTCDLLVLALFCCCCCFSVCGAAAPVVQSPAAQEEEEGYVDVLCPGKDGKLRWRLPDESGWRECARRPKEADESGDDCARLCIEAWEAFSDSEFLEMCTSVGDQSNVMFQMAFETSGDLKNCTSATAPNDVRATAPGPSGTDGQAQGGVGGRPGEAAEAPNEKPPEPTEKGGSDPTTSETVNAIPPKSNESAAQSVQRAATTRPRKLPTIIMLPN
ncbi:surface antigen TASV, putative,hypothetical protein [Trypanosoma cruzi marinkellei]|uniref:Mucin-like glycoprotein n=1 Tax=Trypanosoma cruzi marinkellei TaxID=85056 RepID=K2N3N4_TRYCR|nr:surface antigen TASV, putative,hypothetical protein [Trypanosoma cruzi marinkellei]